MGAQHAKCSLFLAVVAEGSVGLIDSPSTGEFLRVTPPPFSPSPAGAGVPATATVRPFRQLTRKNISTRTAPSRPFLHLFSNILIAMRLPVTSAGGYGAAGKRRVAHGFDTPCKPPASGASGDTGVDGCAAPLVEWRKKAPARERGAATRPLESVPCAGGGSGIGPFREIARNCGRSTSPAIAGDVLSRKLENFRFSGPFSEILPKKPLSALNAA